MRPELQKHKHTVATLLSCEDGNKAGSTENFHLIFTTTHRAEKKKECKQKKTARQEKHQLERI